MSIGMEIRNRRKPLMSQEAFAEALGLSQSSISQWERDDSLPAADQLPKIARILGCSVEDLVAGLDEAYDRLRRDLARHTDRPSSDDADAALARLQQVHAAWLEQLHEATDRITALVITEEERLSRESGATPTRAAGRRRRRRKTG